MKLIHLLLIIIFSSTFIEKVAGESYHCWFPCKHNKDNECSLFYHRKSSNTFYEEKKWRVYDAQENVDHLLLIRNGFPPKDDLPKGLI